MLVEFSFSERQAIHLVSVLAMMPHSFQSQEQNGKRGESQKKERKCLLGN
jgi:hypothetical protein